MKPLIKDKKFAAGLITGLTGGIFGNIFINSLYRWIDGEPRGNNLITFLVSLILFVWLMYKLFKGLNSDRSNK
jgi:hypothetical protein